MLLRRVRLLRFGSFPAPLPLRVAHDPRLEPDTRSILELSVLSALLTYARQEIPVPRKTKIKGFGPLSVSPLRGVGWTDASTTVLRVV